jgi:hypothetical protein
MTTLPSKRWVVSSSCASVTLGSGNQRVEVPEAWETCEIPVNSGKRRPMFDSQRSQMRVRSQRSGRLAVHQQASQELPVAVPSVQHRHHRAFEPSRNNIYCLDNRERAARARGDSC